MEMRKLIAGAASVSLVATMIASCTPAGDEGEDNGQSSATCTKVEPARVAIKAGSFAMGQDGIYREEGPVQSVSIDGFWIDNIEVTGGQFDEFVQATGHKTVAERPVDPSLFNVPADQIPADMLKAGSAVFIAPDKPTNNFGDWWKYVPGAFWRKPLGPDGPDMNPDEPVVHLAFEDIAAYAKWRGGRLPTEAEWEYAARAGQENYTEQPQQANSWQGVFPVVNEGKDGHKGLAPVGCYEANPWGLYDMIGNAWEMTSDFYAPGHDPKRPAKNPKGPSENTAYDPQNPGIASRVIKGGSFLCAPNYCQRYRPAARSGRDPGLGASNVGFRLAYDKAAP